MSDDFRKKMFRGAKIEDLILDLEELTKYCEKNIQETTDLGRQRFFEGMSIAYKIVSMKLKGNFDYMEKGLTEEFYNSVTQKNKKGQLQATSKAKTNITCSFCNKSYEDVKHLVPGPGVAICDSCLDFGKQLIESNSI